MACHEKFGLQTITGYLENGLPPKYGSGAEAVVASVHKNPINRHGWITDLVGPGDIDRVIIEWRSLLRQITHAPELDWPRWRALQGMAKAILNETESPTIIEKTIERRDWRAAEMFLSRRYREGWSPRTEIDMSGETVKRVIIEGTVPADLTPEGAAPWKKQREDAAQEEIKDSDEPI